MICQSCRRESLPGGVRCTYCGTRFHAADVDFDAPVGAVARPAIAPSRARPTRGRAGTGLAGGLALLAIKGKSLLALLKFGKLATTLLSMMAFVVVGAHFYGSLQFAIGIVVVIFVHEMGHVLVNARHGLKQTAPVFLPLMGAVIFLKNFPDNPKIQSESGAGGPAAGFLASAVCLVIGVISHNAYWFALAYVSFAINLFNLLPFPPLDGSHVATVFSPELWNFVLAAIALWVIKDPTGVLIPILLFNVFMRMQQGVDGRYNLAEPRVRVRMAAVYVLLCFLLAGGMSASRRIAAHYPGPWFMRPAAVSTTRIRGAGSHPGAAPNISVPLIPISAESRRAAVSVGWLLQVLVLIAAAILLFKASGARLTCRMLRVPLTLGAVLGCLTVGWVEYPTFPFNAGIAGWCIAGASLALGVHQAISAQAGLRPDFRSVEWKWLGWVLAAALTLAYYHENLSLAALALVSAGIFYSLNPALFLSLAARWAENVGLLERALLLHQRALERCSDPGLTSKLHRAIGEMYLVQGRGADALHEFDAAGSRLAPPIGDLADLDLAADRVKALAFQDRFDEALAICEGMLQSPPIDPIARYRLPLILELLSILADLRGWSDECLTRADQVLKIVAKSAGGSLRQRAASASLQRAASLLAMNRVDEAAETATRAQTLDQGARTAVSLALVRARIAIGRADFKSGLRECDQILSRLPGTLEARFWRATALRSLDRTNDAQVDLSDLAARFPSEHWGKRARSVLSG